MLTVCDELLCSGSHTAEIFWQFAPECQVDCEGGRVVAERDGVRLELEPPDAVSVTLVLGRGISGSSRACESGVPRPEERKP